MGSNYWTARQRGSTSWLLIVTLDGSGRFIHRDGHFDVGPGDAALLKPNRRHEYGTSPASSHWSFLWVHFHLRSHWLGLLHWTSAGSGMMRESLAAADLETVSQALRNAVDAKRLTTRFSDALALNHLERALLTIAASTPAQSARLDARVKQTIAKLQRDLGANHRIADLAAAVGLSESRFAHLFAQEMGVSPRKYLERLRIEKAKLALELTDLSISEIANSLGFACEFYFSKRFFEVTGERPSFYRIRIRS